MIVATRELTEKPDALSFEARLQMLPDERKAQILQSANAHRQMELLVGYELLHDTMEENGLLIDPPIIALHEQGKPYLKNYPELHFNISHCKSTIALAINHKPIGIDIESPRTFSDALLRKVFNKEEQEDIMQATNPINTFLYYWTRKEAFLKCLGTGIDRPLAGVPSTLDLEENHISINTETLPNGCVVSVAVTN